MLKLNFIHSVCANKMNESSELGLPVICRALKVYFGQGQGVNGVSLAGI